LSIPPKNELRPLECLLLEWVRDSEQESFDSSSGASAERSRAGGAAGVCEGPGWLMVGATDVLGLKIIAIPNSLKDLLRHQPYHVRGTESCTTPAKM
jgi:hypothetical protein